MTILSNVDLLEHYLKLVTQSSFLSGQTSCNIIVCFLSLLISLSNCLDERNNSLNSSALTSRLFSVS